MPKLYSILFVAIACLIGTLVISCGDDNGADSSLMKVNEMIELHPAEALEILNTIEDPESLNKDLYMKYVVFNSLAQLMNDKPIPEGNELIEARAYFHKKKDWQVTAMANYLIGSRFQQDDNYVQSLRWFYEAAHYAEKSGLDKLMGKALYRISYAYFEQGVYSEAARQSKQALSYFEYIPNSEDDIMTSLSMIGLWHYKTNQLDSALVWYKEGLDVALSVNDTASEARFRAFIGTVLGTQGETEKALPYLDEAITEARTTEDSLLVYKGFLQTYNAQNKVREATPYARILSRRLSDMKIKSRQRETMRELSRYYERAGDLASALIYRKVVADLYAKMELEKSAEDFLTIKEDYDLSLKNMDMENQRLWYLTLIVSILFVSFIIGVMFYLRMRAIDFKNEEKEYEHKLLEERVENFEYLRSMYKSTLIRLMQMDKRVQDMIDESQKTEGEIPVVYQEMQSLIKGLRRNSGYHYVRIAEDYIKKQPNGEEFSKVLDRPNKIIFMLCTLRYNQSEIASIVGMTRKSVMMRRYDIRNTLIKFGVPEKKANEIIFFDQEKVGKKKKANDEHE